MEQVPSARCIEMLGQTNANVSRVANGKVIDVRCEFLNNSVKHFRRLLIRIRKKMLLGG